jgi:hypothetical protein
MPSYYSCHSILQPSSRRNFRKTTRFHIQLLNTVVEPSFLGIYLFILAQYWYTVMLFSLVLYDEEYNNNNKIQSRTSKHEQKMLSNYDAMQFMNNVSTIALYYIILYYIICNTSHDVIKYTSSSSYGQFEGVLRFRGPTPPNRGQNVVESEGLPVHGGNGILLLQMHGGIFAASVYLLWSRKFLHSFCGWRLRLCRLIRATTTPTTTTVLGNDHWKWLLWHFLLHVLFQLKFAFLFDRGVRLFDGQEKLVLRPTFISTALPMAKFLFRRRVVWFQQGGDG